MQLAGGGKRRSEPKPPIYKPPVMGELQYGASYSYSEILDLISDGPIEGLCNKYGKTMEGVGILQGIYFDDTPVAVTTGPDDIRESVTAAEEDVFEIMPSRLDDSVGTGIKNCQLFFKGLQQNQNRGLVTALSGGPIMDGELSTSPSVNMIMIRQRTHSSRCQGRSPDHVNKVGYYVRAYIKKKSLGAGSVPKEFYMYTNGTSRTEFGNYSNAVFRTASKNRGEIDSIAWCDAPTYNKNTGFPQGAASSTVKFGIGFGGSRMGRSIGSTMLWHETDWQMARIANGFEGAGGGLNATHDGTNVEALTTICNLFNNGATTEARALELLTLSEEEVEQFGRSTINAKQSALAARALSRFGIDTSGGNSVMRTPGRSTQQQFERWMEKSSNSREKRWTVVVKVDTTNTDIAGKQLFDADGTTKNMYTYPYGLTHKWSLYAKMKAAGIRISDVTCPEVDGEGVTTGRVYGFLVFSFRDIERRDPLKCGGVRFGYGYTYAIPKNIIDLFADIDCFTYADELQYETADDSNYDQFDPVNQKYNYTNVLAEVRRGTEVQPPFDYFKSVFIDHKYNAPLFGPFSSKSQFYPQRIEQNTRMLDKDSVLKRGSANNYNLELDGRGLPKEEGSDDERRNADNVVRDYAAWAKNSLVRWDELAIPVTHYVYNPNVRKCFVTLNISNLSDTLVKEVDNVEGADANNNDLKVGTKFPTVLNIRVETGRVSENGTEYPSSSHTYRIVALIEGATLIDIGNPDYKGDKDKEYIVSLEGRDNLALPFTLPQAVTTKQVQLSADGTIGFQADSIDQDSVEKRYIRVTKLSFETNSILLAKDVAVDKITEIIDVDLPYPFSAIVGTKLDSRSLGSIPARSYDCKLKLVRVPSNYFPQTANGRDKRYWNSKANYDAVSDLTKTIYRGDWDGTFKEDLEWTDNPAWILYDLLTNQRYGMGSHIDIDSINIWQLYEIGRFCDAVNDEGIFEGVTDGRGGLEPRFSCNVVFDQGQKIYDAINTICGIFRGRAFFSNSEVNFVDDRPRDPINLFTNESVKDGMFYYSNYRRDEQFNTIEVGFKDRFDNFAPKIEVIEDEEDIKQRGIFKKRIEGVGITSRAMARRVGQHQIFNRITENQTVAFTAGLETLLCQPGDLITIEDELKSNKSNFGKVLAVNLEDETIRLSNTFVDADMNGKLTVFNPTGRNTLEDMSDEAVIIKQRYDSFSVTGVTGAGVGGINGDMWASGKTMFTGQYGFSGYTAGYSVNSEPPLAIDEDGESRFEQYALYTGVTGATTTDYPYIYFETGVTGWVLGSGVDGGITDARAQYSGTYISTWTGTQTLLDFSTGEITVLDMEEDDKRTASTVSSETAFFSGFDPASFYPESVAHGIRERDIPTLVSPDQMTVLNVTGTILSTPAELTASGLSNYGSLISGFDKPDLLPFVKLGSPAKFEIKNASPFIYKVVSMKEEAINEYLVSATKYETGKFKLIEDNESIEHLANTYSYQTAQTINGITYETLDTPVLTGIQTGVPDLASQTFQITGTWGEVSNVTGYNVILTYPNGEVIDATSDAYTGYSFTGLNQVGVYSFSVNALGNKAHSLSNGYFDSQYDSTGIFVVYDELLTYSTNFIDRIQILNY